MTQLQYPPPGPYGQPQDAPGATAGLTLGICSIVFAWPIVGLILGFVGLQKSSEAKRLCDMNPGVYGNAGVALAGYVCSIIGICLSALSTLCGCGYFILIILAIAGAGGGF